MALVVIDRVQETTTTTGTGTLTLAGAVTGYQSFAAIGNGNTTYYSIFGTTEWEVGIGTYTSSGTTLSRTTVLASSNAGALVNFSAGVKTVICTYPAGRAAFVQASGAIYENSTTISASYTLDTGKNAMSVGPITLSSGVTVTVPSGQRWVVL